MEVEGLMSRSGVRDTSAVAVLSLACGKSACDFAFVHDIGSDVHILTLRT